MGAAEITILLTLIDRATAWAAVVQKAHTENRNVTEAEVDAFFVADDVAKKRLDDAIAAAKAAGR